MTITYSRPPNSPGEIVSQTAHGFKAGQVVRSHVDGYKLAQADTLANYETVRGMITQVLSADSFLIQDSGPYGSGFEVKQYYLSPTTAGDITATRPSIPDQGLVPVGIGNPFGQISLKFAVMGAVV